MSVIRAREKRSLIPSSRLTSDSNVAEPLIHSHRESIAYAQAQKARAAKEAEETETEQLVPNPVALDSAGSSLSVRQVTPIAASPATSKPGSVLPTASSPSENEDELNDQSTMAARTGKKRKRHDTTGESFGIGPSAKNNSLAHDAGETALVDEDGMYRDVVVLDIDSDSTDPENKNKNKNPTADIEHFFTPTKHVKGDKKGRRQCKTCA